LGKKAEIQIDGNTIDLGFQVNFKNNRKRFIQLTRLERNPVVLSYFKNNLQILFNLQSLKKPLKKEWKALWTRTS